MSADITRIVRGSPTLRVRTGKMYRTLRRWPIFPTLLLSIVVFAGITAPLIAPHDPERGILQDRHIPPAWIDVRTAPKTVVQRVSISGRTTEIAMKDAILIQPNAQLGDLVQAVTRPGGSTKYLLGTDKLGRDVLSRVIYGARISLIVAGVTLGIGGTIGVTLGLAAGWYGRAVDETIMRLVDIKLSIPLILIALVFHWMRKLTETGNLDLNTCVGRQGTVYLDIQEGMLGEVRVNVSGVATHVKARTADSKELKAGVPVTVTRVLDQSTVEVRPDEQN